jgi:hypothetical protein
MRRKSRRLKLSEVDLKRQKLIPSEYAECKAFWAFAKKHPILRESLVKHTNEHLAKTLSEKNFLRSLLAIGMRPGLIDYQLYVDNDRWFSLCIEMKRSDQRGAKRDPNQEKFMSMMRRQGHCAVYAFSASEAIDICLKYLQNEI